jgi:lipoate-protein ligase B
MKQFTAERTSDTVDEIWLVQHPPTYTRAGRKPNICSTQPTSQW